MNDRVAAAGVERAFSGWEIAEVTCADTAPDLVARLSAFDERFHRLRRAARG
jgi:hypothetical protein